MHSTHVHATRVNVHAHFYNQQWLLNSVEFDDEGKKLLSRVQCILI